MQNNITTNAKYYCMCLLLRWSLEGKTWLIRWTPAIIFLLHFNWWQWVCAWAKAKILGKKISLISEQAFSAEPTRIWSSTNLQSVLMSDWEQTLNGMIWRGYGKTVPSGVIPSFKNPEKLLIRSRLGIPGPHSITDCKWPWGNVSSPLQFTWKNLSSTETSWHQL